MRVVGRALLCLCCTIASLHAADDFVLGGTLGPSWEEAAAEAPVIDFDSRPGWLLPRSVQTGINVAAGSLERGGFVVSPNAQAVLRLSTSVLAEQLARVVDGNHDTAFEVKDVVATGVFLVLDLGARFGVDHISFFPRASFRTDFMKGYVMSVNDGVFGADIVAASPDKLPNRSLFTIVGQEQGNSRDTVDVRFPLQYVRYVRLESTQRFNWEIDELELFGRGFVPEAEYLTVPLDLGRPTLWGRVGWAPERTGREGKSRLVIRTRTGDAPEIDDSWSPWSAPLTGSDEQIQSPSPRRYIQYRIRFESDGLEDGMAIDSLSFGHSPALATSTLAEVWPQSVEVGQDTTFTYAVRIAGANGIDGLQIDTGAPVVQVRSLRIDGVDVAYTTEPGDTGLLIGFAPQQGDHLLAVDFDTAVLRYETVLEGRLLASGSDSLPQRVVAGDATTQLPGNDLSVRVPLRGFDVLHNVELTPGAFSPNGDGVNDEVVIAYDVLHLTQAVPVAVDIFDLSGRRVARLSPADEASGRHLSRWDGHDDDGNIVPPGLYLVHVEIETDQGTQRSSRSVCVAY
jgi:hypothetical protein